MTLLGEDICFGTTTQRSIVSTIIVSSNKAYIITTVLALFGNVICILYIFFVQSGYKRYKDVKWLTYNIATVLEQHPEIIITLTLGL